MPKRPPDIRKLATRQRWLVWMVLLLLMMQVLPILIEEYMRPGPAAEIVGGIFALMLMLTMFLVVVGAILIMVVDGTHVVMIVLAAVFLFAPCVNLLILLLINRRATRTLRAAGLKVGLVGVNPEQLERILNPSLCTKCGYNLTGNLSGLCPECGTALPLTPPIVPQ